MFGKPSATTRRIWTVVATLAVCFALLPMAVASAATAYTLTISDAGAFEGTPPPAGTTALAFTVTLAPAAAAGTTVTVNYATADGEALAASDYVAASGSLSFGPTESTKTITVLANKDAVTEVDETFTLSLSGAASTGAGDTVTLADGTGVGTIANDDALPAISISSPSGFEASLVLNFIVLLDHASASPVSVAYATGGGTASIVSDYVPATGTLSFAAGEVSKTLSITLLNDTTPEGTENFNVVLSAPSGATGTPTGVGTIWDDDSPVLSVNSPSWAESGSPAGFFRFTITADRGWGAAPPPAVTYTTIDGTATVAGLDYGFFTGVCNVWVGPSASGTYACYVDVPLNDDALVEADETFLLVLTNPINATLGTATGTGTILDNENLPTIDINDTATANESAGTMNFTVTLSAPYSRPVTVQYYTGDNTALFGLDYVRQGIYPPPTTLTLTIPAGATTGTISIPLINDTAAEATESFFVTIVAPTWANMAPPAAQCMVAPAQCWAIGTITDDDKPVVSIVASGVPAYDGPATEGTSMWGRAVLDADPVAAGLQSVPYAVSVNYATVDGTATAGADYLALSGTLTFMAGETVMMVAPLSTIATYLDGIYEGSETFSIHLSSPVNATIGTADRTFTILDGNTKPTVNVWSPVAPHEETSVGIGFYLYLGFSGGTFATTLPVTVTYATADFSAIAGQDYHATSGTVTFPCSAAAPCSYVGPPATTTNPRIDAPYVLLIDDPIYEIAAGPFEAFDVWLSNPVNASLGINPGTALIEDNENPPLVNIGNASALESAGQMLFNASLSGPADMPVVAVVRTNEAFYGEANDGSGWPVADGDYLQNPPGGWTLTFAPMEMTKTFGVTIYEDTDVEINERFLVQCGAPIPVNAVCGTSGTGTILDNDVLKFNINSPAAVSEAAGTLTFTITLDRPWALAPGGTPPSVKWTTANGTALGIPPAGGDFTSATGTCSAWVWDAALGLYKCTFAIAIANDVISESTETFTVVLSTPVRGEIGTGTGTGTITDDDYNLTINDIALPEGDSGTKAFTFTVTLSKPAPAAGITVDWGTNAVTATFGAACGAVGIDYVAAAGTLVFNPGESSKTITVTVCGDLTEESDETTRIELVNALMGGAPAANLAITRAPGFLTIENDDIPMVSITDVVKAEGNAGSSNATFTVTLSKPSQWAKLINFSTADGATLPATAGADYTATTGTLTIAAGSLTGTINVAVLGDTIDELDETFFVNLVANAANPTLGFADAQGLGTITDDDADVTAPAVTVPANMTIEATGPGGATATFTATATDLHGITAAGVVCTPASGSMFPLGPTTVHCTATDPSGNMGHASFLITVVDTTPPVITLLGLPALTIPYGLPYADAGATATDLVDGDLTGLIVTVNPVDVFTMGTYHVTYDVTDSHGNHAIQVHRMVTVAYFCGGLEATIIGTAGDDALNGTAGVDVIMGLEGADTIHGLGGNDLICGGPGNDMLYGGEGDDTIFANAGADMLYGEAGNDTLYGGTGNDRFFGGAGDDLMEGGTGFDVLDYTGAAAMTVDLFAGTASGDGSDSLMSFERLVGSAHDDTLIGGPADNTIWGGAGNDLIYGGGGNDQLYGQDGDDTIYGQGGDDALYGGPGEDTLIGGQGNDIIDLVPEGFHLPL